MPRISVDMDACARHGQCEFAAEAVFQLDDDGQPRYCADVADGDLPAVERAIRACPTRAISLVH
jgi:ferredoxin